MTWRSDSTFALFMKRRSSCFRLSWNDLSENELPYDRSPCATISCHRHQSVAFPGSELLPARFWRASWLELESRASIRFHLHSQSQAKACVRDARRAAPATAPSPSSVTLCAPAKTYRRHASSARSPDRTNPHEEVRAHYTPLSDALDRYATPRLLPPIPARRRSPE